MLQAIRERVTIKPGGMIELCHPELPAGVEAEVIIMVEQPAEEPPPLASFIGKGKGCFSNAAAIDTFIRAERDTWER
ncbi:MAG: hypothetical protein HY268_09075 [Deltaproteobacteria bacterium]|nr:hypothetical protein [Deltaproteobacteria bacterium]